MAGLCAGLLISCAKESFTVGVEPEDGDRIYADGDEVIRGWIRIKLSEEGPEALRTGQFTRGEAATGDGDIDEVAAALGATEVRRVFRDGGRFAERRRRYGLHLWYDIRFDEEIPVSRAGAEFAALPGVAYAEPLPRFLPKRCTSRPCRRQRRDSGLSTTRCSPSSGIIITTVPSAGRKPVPT